MLEITNKDGIFLREAYVKTMFLLCNVLVCKVTKTLKKWQKQSGKICIGVKTLHSGKYMSYQENIKVQNTPNSTYQHCMWIVPKMCIILHHIHMEIITLDGERQSFTFGDVGETSVAKSKELSFTIQSNGNNRGHLSYQAKNEVLRWTILKKGCICHTMGLENGVFFPRSPIHIPWHTE